VDRVRPPVRDAGRVTYGPPADASQVPVPVTVRISALNDREQREVINVARGRPTTGAAGARGVGEVRAANVRLDRLANDVVAPAVIALVVRAAGGAPAVPVEVLDAGAVEVALLHPGEDVEKQAAVTVAISAAVSVRVGAHAWGQDAAVGVGGVLQGQADL